ncbi:nucleolar complex protein [Trifolium repens]|nr:nucleolar complex protein [Trifolium repens]
MLCKSTAFPTPPVGGLFNSFISSISKRSIDTGTKDWVEAASLFNMRTHLNLRGKYLAVGTRRATPEIIWVSGYASCLKSDCEL